MVRVLLIGRKAAAFGERIAERASEALELDLARLPAAGLRQFESTPPDALVIIDASSAERAATMVAAVRERPIGQLIPVIVIAPPAGHDEADQVDAWLSPQTPPEKLLADLEEALGVELQAVEGAAAGVANSPTEPVDTSSPSSQPDQPSYFIEEIDEADGPRRLRRDAIFSSPSGGRARPEDGDHLGEEAIRRKLKAVRHEDYYAILELRRGAEGAVVREAFHRLYRRYDPEELDFELVHRLQDELAEIRDAFEDAWAVLGDPKLRKAYLEHTTKR
jgi:hypothetical protein